MAECGCWHNHAPWGRGPPAAPATITSMRTLDEADALYHGLRERDRTIASLQSKQRMVTLFEHLLDRPARDAVAARLAAGLDEVRKQARALALELARAALLELDIQDLPRIAELERSFAAHLDAEPAARL